MLSLQFSESVWAAQLVTIVGSHGWSVAQVEVPSGPVQTRDHFVVLQRLLICPQMTFTLKARFKEAF